MEKLRPRPHVSGYFRIRNFFFPDTATVHTHPANPEKNKSVTNLITCGRVIPDIFESDDVKSVSSLSPNNKPEIFANHFELGSQTRLGDLFHFVWKILFNGHYVLGA